jgi:hypothetical protein
MGKNPDTNEDYALLFISKCKYKGNDTLYGVSYESMARVATT